MAQSSVRSSSYGLIDCWIETYEELLTTVTTLVYILPFLFLYLGHFGSSVKVTKMIGFKCV